MSNLDYYNILLATSVVYGTAVVWGISIGKD
jgi:hypothetical protein